MSLLLPLFFASLILCLCDCQSADESCIPKEFTENPDGVDKSCEGAIENRWRGELSFDKTETYIEVHWKKIVQDWKCVKAMEFYLDGVKQKDVWGRQNEKQRIDSIGKFSLKVEVYFLDKSRTGSTCYGTPGKCKCFEATTSLNTIEGRDGGTSETEKNEDVSIGSISPLILGAASGGVILFLALLLTLAICCIKLKRRERRRLEKAEEEEMTANTDVCNVYGVYATSNEETDYSLVIDTNPDYES